MIVSILSLMTLAARPEAAWSFLIPSGGAPSVTKLPMADGDDEGPVMNKWSR